MTQTKRFQDDADRGFTLVEILVVFCLMSLILGISSVFFANTLPKAKHKAAAKEIVSTIKYAKNLAAAKNAGQILNFDLDARSYGIKGRETKSIPDGVELVIYESDVNTNPITQGEYNITYDSTGTGNWDRISLVRGNRIIQIKSDPILTAVIVDDKKDNRHE